MKPNLNFLRHHHDLSALFALYLVVAGCLVATALGVVVVEGWNGIVQPPAVAASALTASPEPGLALTNPPTTFVRRLDGAIVTSLEEADALPFAVMIENSTTVRPQSGLSQASVVYETLAEGGITRFLALYLPGVTVEKIGPVRSARHYYVDWAEEYAAPYAHAGGSPLGLSQITRDHVPDLNGIGNAWRYFWRDRAFSAPHNLFTNAEQLRTAATELGYERPASFTPWQFSDAPTGDRLTPATTVSVNFSSASYAARFEYDQSTQRYRRFNGGLAHLDRSTGEQLSFDNVIVQFVARPVSLGQKGRIDIETEGEGQAMLFHNGLVQEGTWKKSGVAGRTQFFGPDGLPLQLSRGTTWVAVVPSDRKVEYQ